MYTVYIIHALLIHYVHYFTGSTHRPGLAAIMPTYYLQDILNESSAPEKFTQHPSENNKKEESVLIVDFGSWQCRVGLSNESAPSSKHAQNCMYGQTDILLIHSGFSGL